MHPCFRMIGEIRIACRIERIERAAVVRRERELVLDPSRQIGIGCESAFKSDQIGYPLDEGLFSTCWLKPACGDDRAGENLSQMRSRHRLLACVDCVGSADPRFDDVEVGKTKAVEPLGKVSVERTRIAIAHAVEDAARASRAGISPDLGPLTSWSDTE